MERDIKMKTDQDFIKQDDIKHDSDTTSQEVEQENNIYDLIQARSNLFNATTQDHYNERPQASKTIHNERQQQNYNDILYSNDINKVVF